MRGREGGSGRGREGEGADLLCCSGTVLPSEIIDVHYEAVAMGTNHVPHFLMVHALIFLEREGWEREEEGEEDGKRREVHYEAV